MFGDLAPVERKGNIIHTTPKGDFDAQLILDAYQEVFQLAAPLERWVLFEHPDTSAGLSTTSLMQLINCYRHAASIGCIGIMVGGTSIFKKILNHNIPVDFPVTVTVSDDESLLMTLAETLLKQSD